MMVSPVNFAYFFDYLVLARAKFLGWIRDQPPAVYTRTFEIGLGSIRATLIHIASAEFGYARRLRGRGSEPEHNPFTLQRLPDLEPFIEAWERQQPETRDALATIGDPSRAIEYIPAWIKPPIRVRAVAGGIAGQLLFHEIHHRAQLMAMLRQAGVKAENLDYSLLMDERTPVS